MKKNTLYIQSILICCNAIAQKSSSTKTNDVLKNETAISKQAGYKSSIYKNQRRLPIQGIV